MHTHSLERWQHAHSFLGEHHARNERKTWIVIGLTAAIIGALVITNWSYSLVRDTGRVLLDVTPDGRLAAAIRQRLETGSDRVTDLHLWQVGPGHYGAIVSLASHQPQPPARYKAALRGLDALSHVTVEVAACA